MYKAVTSCPSCGANKSGADCGDRWHSVQVTTERPDYLQPFPQSSMAETVQTILASGFDRIVKIVSN